MIPLGHIKTSKLAASEAQDIAKEKELFEFLPAAIEVEQTPASKMGQAIIWSIVVLLTIAILWAFFGKVDIVAVAQGKVIPSEHTKHIQSIQTARINQVHVEDGQEVQRGDVLITLDDTQAQADVRRLTNELGQRREEAQRIRTFYARVSEDQPAYVQDFHLQEEVAKELSKEQVRLLAQELMDFQSKLDGYKNEQSRLQTEQKMVEVEVNKKKRILPVLMQRVDALKTLHQKSYGSKLQYLELKQDYIEEEQDLLVQQTRRQQLEVLIDANNIQRQTFIGEQRKNSLAQLQALQLQVSGLEQDLIKAKENAGQYVLTSPIHGQVQQLAVHTIGGVVSPAQILMAIVPQDSGLEVDAMILNKDIGFVQEGQAAEVKVSTFNFTKYGLIPAEIKTISKDAIQDEQLGLVYSARIKLHQDALQIDDRRVRLSPGMAVTTEIKTGYRRLIEFFLSPLLRYKQESLQER